MQDWCVAHLESLLINQYIIKTKKHHTSVFALTYMCLSASEQIKSLFFWTGCTLQWTKTRAKEIMCLGIYPCFLNCKKKEDNLVWTKSFSNSSKTDMNLYSRNKYQDVISARSYIKSAQMTGSYHTWIHYKSIQWWKKIMYKGSFNTIMTCMHLQG